MRAHSKPPGVPCQELEKMAKAYEIEIVAADHEFQVQTAHGVIFGRNAEQKEMKCFPDLLAEEFFLYPRELVRRAKLQRVVLCSDLSFAGQPRSAIPGYEDNTLYLDISSGSNSRPYQRKVIHHEFFHIIDYHDDGNVYQDERWASLNPATFKYGGGGKAERSPTGSILTSKYPGFLNTYSMSAVEEDKAEVFANLIVDPAHVEDRAKADRVLNSKVKRMKELLAKFCPEIDGSFWENIRIMKRTAR